jgi:hypothetical protein
VLPDVDVAPNAVPVVEVVAGAGGVMVPAVAVLPSVDMVPNVDGVPNVDVIVETGAAGF